VYWSSRWFECEWFAEPHHAGFGWFFWARETAPWITCGGCLIGAVADDREAGQIGVGGSTDLGAARRVEAVHDEAGADAVLIEVQLPFRPRRAEPALVAFSNVHQG
jgi:hypothetical protein